MDEIDKEALTRALELTKAEPERAEQCQSAAASPHVDIRKPRLGENRGFWAACAHWIGCVWAGECLSNCLIERGLISIVPGFTNGKRPEGAVGKRLAKPTRLALAWTDPQWDSPTAENRSEINRRH